MGKLKLSGDYISIIIKKCDTAYSYTHISF